ncbi:MAG: hypothetical protein J6T73_05085 [Clostridia bacterium]|nr:hypothetical protein [Clostridia bacterium]
MKPYNPDAEVSSVGSEVIASNDLLTLSWDDEKNNILLTCKQTGKVWSTVPDDVNDDVETSSLNIRVQDTFIRREDKYYSNNADRISAEKIENGVKVTYSFDEVSIAVPVNYTLRDDSLLISINGKEIVEGGTRYQLIAANPAPMLCRTGVETENAYIFVPKALGGTVDTKVNADEARELSGYNSNIASMEVESFVNQDDVTGFKCYGIKDGDSALFCIAEDTPGATGINLLAGSKMNSYSTVSSTFYLTDYDYFYGAYILDKLIKQLSAPYMGTISVGVYPLAGEKADYNGFAECYRNYLYKAGYITDKKMGDSSPYSITYMGGVITTASVAGVPTKTLNAMTTFSEARELTDKLKQETGISPVVRLSGYGKSGVNIGKIAGGYGFSGKLGSDESRKELEEY